jgi:hypothetical protein
MNTLCGQNAEFIINNEGGHAVTMLPFGFKGLI